MREQLKLPETPSAQGAGRNTAVLFAELAVADGARLPDRERLRLVETLGQAVDLSGGRIVHRRESDLMALFSTPDAAAAAAVRMHVYAEALAQSDEGLEVRIGFHSGPVKQRGSDIFGDTVDLALLMVEKAKEGQIVTSETTAASLSPEVQERVKPLGHVKPKGADGKLLLGELVWRKGAHEAKPPILSPSPAVRAALRLAYGGTVIVRRREGDVVTLGREGCDLVIGGPAVSRRHCTIVRRDAVFVLTDHSTNGTYVAPDRQPEILARRESVALSGQGKIGLGVSCAATKDAVSYACG